jgi:hypothetical protein
VKVIGNSNRSRDTGIITDREMDMEIELIINLRVDLN